MSSYSSDAKQRRSKKYIALHAQLRRELEKKNIIKPEARKPELWWTK